MITLYLFLFPENHRRKSTSTRAEFLSSQSTSTPGMITLYNFAFSLSPGLSVEAFYIKGRGKIVVTKGQLLELGFSSGTTMGIQAILKAGRLSSVPKAVSQPISMLQLPITSMLSRQAIGPRADSNNLAILQFNATTLDATRES